MSVKGAPKKRRLSDLYVVGKDIEIDDGTGDPVVLYMRRPNPFEHEEALRDGNSSRARITLKMRDRKTEDYDILEADLVNMGNPTQQVNFLLGERESDFYTRAYAYVSNQDHWSDDTLIESIQDNLDKWYVMEDEMKEGHEEWEDFQRAKEKAADFNREVEAKVDELKAEQRHKYNDESEEEIKEMCRKALIDKASGLAFFRDYRLSCIYFGTREHDDHNKRYFTSKQELKELSYEVQVQLLKAYDDLDMGRDEIKNSPSADPSSLESAQPEGETSELSGLESVSV